MTILNKFKEWNHQQYPLVVSNRKRQGNKIIIIIIITIKMMMMMLRMIIILIMMTILIIRILMIFSSKLCLIPEGMNIEEGAMYVNYHLQKLHLSFTTSAPQLLLNVEVCSCWDKFFVVFVLLKNFLMNTPLHFYWQDVKLNLMTMQTKNLMTVIIHFFF